MNNATQKAEQRDRNRNANQTGERLPQVPEHLEEKAGDLWGKLINHATAHMINPEDLTEFCRAYYEFEFWRKERIWGATYGDHALTSHAQEQARKAMKRIERHAHIIEKLREANYPPGSEQYRYSSGREW